MAKRKQAKPKPLVPYFRKLARLNFMGVVVMRVPRGTAPEAERAALKAQRDMADKINRSHEKDHYYEKGWR